MDPIEWRPDWSVGHDELDEQHQMLLELYHRFASAAARGKGSREVAGLLDALVDCGMMKSKGEARRMVRQNAVRVAGDVVSDEMLVLTEAHVREGRIELQVGKKRHHHILLAD